MYPVHAAAWETLVMSVDYVPTGPWPRSPVLTARQQRSLGRARRLARLLDAQWGVGRLRFGAETLADLIPGVGDAVSAAVSVYQLIVARQLGLPRALRLRMWGNITTDLLLGLLPVLGDAADTVFKAHLRNQQILDDYARNRQSPTRTPFASLHRTPTWSSHSRR